jgi:hypothetical protein
MVLSLLLQVLDAGKTKVGNSDISKLGDALIDGLNTHIKQLTELQAQHAKDLAFEQHEQSKRITTDDLHDGFDNKVSISSASLLYLFLILATLVCTPKTKPATHSHWDR